MLEQQFTAEIINEMDALNSTDDLFCRVLRMNGDNSGTEILRQHYVMLNKAEYLYHLIMLTDNEQDLDLLINQF